MRKMRRHQNINKACLTICILLLIGLVSCQSTIQVKCLNDKNCQKVSPYISVIFQFSKNIDPEIIESAWFIDPYKPGRFIWMNNHTVKWTADHPYKPGEKVTIGFLATVLGNKETSAENELVWQTTIRQPAVLLTSSNQNGQELFLLEPYTNKDRVQITNTDGKILEYAGSHDGEKVVFTVLNSDGGADIWEWDRQLDKSFLLLSCGKNICESVSWSPNDTSIILTEQPVDQISITPNRLPQILILDVTSGEKNYLLPDRELFGYDPDWSPNGEWITYRIGLDQGIEAVNLINSGSFYLNSSSGNSGCWSSDSQKFFFSSLNDFDDENHAEMLSSSLLQADFSKKEILTIPYEEKDASGISYLNPVCHPQDDGFLVYVQPSMNIPGRALWWLSSSGERKAIISDDLSVVVSHAAWDTAGVSVLFSVSAFGSNSQGADLMVWERIHQEAPKLLASDVFQPTWLP